MAEATDKLKTLFDEAGARYVENDFGITWSYYSDPHTATEGMDGTLIVSGLTPEQAIAATLGSGTCEFTLEYDRDEVERRKKMYEEEPFGLFPQDMPDSAWTCSNCGQQFKCHYGKDEHGMPKLLPVPDWMKCCPSCGFKIRKAVSA